jgi:hypothetical protein
MKCSQRALLHRPRVSIRCTKEEVIGSQLRIATTSKEFQPPGANPEMFPTQYLVRQVVLHVVYLTVFRLDTPDSHSPLLLVVSYEQGDC